jgi:hypothetical protein
MAKVHKLPVYPPDHPMGMIVPKGGSNCAKCDFVRPGGNCAEKLFQQWNGGPKIPGPIDSYCCDMFEVAVKIRDTKFEDVNL